MKQLFTILALIASFLAIILSVLPLSNLAIIPAIAALVFGFIAFYLSKKAGQVKKIIQFSFFLTIISLSIIIYKAVFNTTEVGNTEALNTKEEASKEEAIEELETLDLEEIDFEDVPIE
jgi:membrane protein implicated in regulation of membrane protease activity